MPSPVFLVLVLIVAASAVLAGTEPATSTTARVSVFVFVFSAWLVSVCLHEFAHAYVAFRGGDHSVTGNDYLRLNPFRYVHPLLSIGLPLLWIAYGGIGLPGGAVLIHRHNLRSRRWASAVSAAGPATNAILVVLSVGALHLFPATELFGSPHSALYGAVGWFAWLQVSVLILNLIPIPGLDGWGILEPYLDSSIVASAQRIKPFGILIVVALLWLPSTSSAFSTLVGHVASGVGISPFAAAYGDYLFRFWKH